MELLRLYFDLTILHACVLLPQLTFLQPNLYSFAFRIVRTTSLHCKLHFTVSFDSSGTILSV